MGTILPTLEMKDIKNVVRNVHTTTRVEADGQIHRHTHTFSEGPLNPLETLLTETRDSLLVSCARPIHPNVCTWFQRAWELPKSPP